MSNKEIRVVVKYPKKEAEILTIEDNLENLQGIVGGYIEWVGGVFQYPIGLYCNEEGKLEGLEPNIPLPGDTLVGPLVVVSTDEWGNNLGLTEAQAERVSTILNSLGRYYNGE